MATLRIQVNGEPSTITLRAFLTAVDGAFRMLRDYDTALSGEPNGSLEWVVTGLAIGSLCVEAEPRSLVEDKNVGPEVVRRFVNGWALIERAAVTPPLLSEQGMAKAKSIVRLIGREGVTGFVVSSASEKAEVSVESVAHVDKLVRVRFRSMGSIEGTIETVSIHRRARFIVYLSRTRKAVTCRVSREKLADMVRTEMMGHRVIVQGVVFSNEKGEPLRIDAERIKVLRADEELPSRVSLRGSDPEFTGDMTTEQYLRDLRDG